MRSSDSGGRYSDTVRVGREILEFSGRLTSFSIGDLIQWAGQERRSGALVVRRSRREKRIYFRDGKVVACLSDNPAEHYGEHLMLHGYLKERQLIEALTYCSHNKKRLGVALVELGLLPEETVQKTLRDRVHAAVCDLFLWQRGVFFFEADPPPEEEILPSPLDTMGLVLEGTRWIDEYRRVRQVLPHDNVVLRRGPSWPPEHPTPLEQRIARSVEEGKDLSELYRETRGSYFRFLEAAFHLCLKEVLDIATVGEPTAAETADLSIADLLLEQASEEDRAMYSRRRLGLPLDLLERLHPRWVTPPEEDEVTELSEPLRRMVRAMDGESPLSALLDDDPDVETRQLDFLQLELRRGRLALLPGSPDALDQRAAGEGGEPMPRRWWRKVLKG